jgi:hypothetical protein
MPFSPGDYFLFDARASCATHRVVPVRRAGLRLVRMYEEEYREPPISEAAYRVYALLDFHGGTMRIGPLLRESQLEPEAFIAAINELCDRCRISITWRPPATPADAELPRPLADARRVTITRFGRRRLRYTSVAM